MFQKTKAYERILGLTKRIRGVAGGTSASKTISILLWLIDYCQTHDGEIVSVVSESFPHLKRGAMRDFLNIMESHGYYSSRDWNKSDYTYQFGTTKMEFFSVKEFSEKVKGARRDILFINEANNIPFESFNQLEVRTKKLIWLDWNPVAEFWFYTEIMNNPKMDVDFITLTYKDNEALDKNIIKSIESRKGNEQWWRVYGLGLLGEVEGRIYTDWAITDKVTHNARLWRYGMDFGYTNDPTAIVAIYEYDGGFILDEICYQKGMSNKDIVDLLKNHKPALVIADSAEPKSIDEIKSYGIQIIPSKKGRDSVKNGIQYVQQQRVTMSKNSLNLIKEYRNYLWMKDRDEKTINEPNDILNHCMDCLIEGTLVKTIKGNIPIEKVSVGDYVYTRNGFNKVVDSYLVKNNASVIKIETSSGKFIIGTSKHRVWTNNRGWQYLRDIRYGDIITTWKQRENITGKTISFIQKRNQNIEENIFIMGLIFCIGRFGKMFMEIYQKICTFIMLIATHIIIRLKILSLYIKLNTVKFLGIIVNLLKRYVILVKKNLIALLSGKMIDFALIDVKASGGETAGWMTLKECASIVERSLCRINTLKENSVQEIVVAKTRVKRRYSVYDITVDSCNEYYANDILVHNSIRYAIANGRKVEWKANDPGGVKHYFEGIPA